MLAVQWTGERFLFSDIYKLMRNGTATVDWATIAYLTVRIALTSARLMQASSNATDGIRTYPPGGVSVTTT